MTHRLVSLAGFLVGLALSLATCSPASTCSSATCLGCCDANGRCAPGNTPTGCGKDGVACVACGMGQQCISNNCAVIINGGGSAGTGGGTSTTGGGTTGTGGGATGTGGGTTGTGGGTSGTGGGTTGTGGGSAGNCQRIMDYDLTGLQGEYVPTMTGTEMAWKTRGGSATGATFAVMEVAIYHPTASVPSTPFNGTVPSSATVRNCTGCFLFHVGCTTLMGPCAADFLATSGSYSVTTATPNRMTGTFVGQATNVFMQAWDVAADQPRTGQPCFQVDVIRWSANWP